MAIAFPVYSKVVGVVEDNVTLTYNNEQPLKVMKNIEG